MPFKGVCPVGPIEVTFFEFHSGAGSRRRHYDSFSPTTTALILPSYTEFIQDVPFSRMATVYIGLTQKVCCKPNVAADVWPDDSWGDNCWSVCIDFPPSQSETDHV
jgi:hypothetical protein